MFHATHRASRRERLIATVKCVYSNGSRRSAAIAPTGTGKGTTVGRKSGS